jgi:hypothetical protein
MFSAAEASEGSRSRVVATNAKQQALVAIPVTSFE